jgi:septum formation topological specificity factor MinE
MDTSKRSDQSIEWLTQGEKISLSNMNPDDASAVIFRLINIIRRGIQYMSVNDSLAKVIGDLPNQSNIYFTDETKEDFVNSVLQIIPEELYLETRFIILLSFVSKDSLYNIVMPKLKKGGLYVVISNITVECGVQFFNSVSEFSELTPEKLSLIIANVRSEQIRSDYIENLLVGGILYLAQKYVNDKAKMLEKANETLASVKSITSVLDQ